MFLDAVLLLMTQMKTFRNLFSEVYWNISEFNNVNNSSSFSKRSRFKVQTRDFDLEVLQIDAVKTADF